MHVRLDDSVRRLDRGRTLIGGAPFRITRLSDAGVRALDDLLAGVDRRRAGVVALGAWLLDAGVLVPDPSDDDPVVVDQTDVTVVVPVRDAPTDLATCLSSIRRLLADAVIVVVDDGSVDETGPAVVAEVHGARVVRRSASGGPAAARNDGLARCDSRLVLFVDADVELVADPLTTLVPYLDDPTAALVAPRVVGTGGAGALGAYERERFPLDIGPTTGRIAPDARITYAPAAVLLCRVEALRAVGGFDESLRYGEDVDLVWRLGDDGQRCWYDGRVVARHPVRSSIHERVRQRFGYGSAAAPLALRHVDRVVPWHGSRSVAVAGLALAGHPLLAGGMVAGNAVALERKLHDRGVPPGEAARLVAQGHAASVGALARAAIRPWWPLTLAFTLLAGRATRRRAMASLLAPPLLGWWRSGREVDPVRWAAAWLADDVAYGAGVWAGWWANRGDRRARRALLPRLVEWPGSGLGNPVETEN